MNDTGPSRTVRYLGLAKKEAFGPGMFEILIVAVALQPPSLMVTTYDPSFKLIAVSEYCGGVVFHLYVYGAPCPPLAAAITEPLLCEHISGKPIAEAVGPGSWGTVAFIVAVQLLESATVTVYDPVISPVAFLCSLRIAPVIFIR